MHFEVLSRPRSGERGYGSESTSIHRSRIRQNAGCRVNAGDVHLRCSLPAFWRTRLRDGAGFKPNSSVAPLFAPGLFCYQSLFRLFR
jgi:hypothetical protein